MIGLKEIAIKKDIALVEKTRLKNVRQKIVNEFHYFVMVENKEELEKYLNIKRIKMFGNFEYSNLLTLKCDDFEIGYICFNDKDAIIQVSSSKDIMCFKINLNSNKVTRYKQYKNVFKYILSNTNKPI